MHKEHITLRTTIAVLRLEYIENLINSRNKIEETLRVAKNPKEIPWTLELCIEMIGDTSLMNKLDRIIENDLRKWKLQFSNSNLHILTTKKCVKCKTTKIGGFLSCRICAEYWCKEISYRECLLWWKNERHA